MTSTHFERFLQEAMTTDRESRKGLDEDELYGLYTSWCLINEVQPEPPQALWDALRAEHIEPGHNNVAMSGPAATDYILASAPDLI